MKTFATVAGMALGASAALLPRADQCCFQLTASGGESGTLGQLSDGQNRIGGGLGEATYCISNGMITDKSGRGCILTPPTTQFQCDKGASPSSGFSIGSGGNLEHNGDSTFYACPATENEYNIYTQKVKGQSKCVQVTLNTGGKCAAPSSMTSSMAMSTSPAMSTETVTTTVTQSKTCPAPQTVTMTETQMEQNTQYKPTTVYMTETQTQQNTQYKPTTVYQTETQTVQNTQVVPTTVYSTKTEEQTETATKQTTVYETKTQQATVTAEQPTTVYKTQTVEETETAKVPVTQYVTKVETQQYCPSTQATSMAQTTQTMNTQTMNTQTMATQTKPASTAQSSACPTNLKGNYQYPHLIVPVSSEHPDQAYGTSYNGQINGTTSSIYNFDIPQSYKGQTCSLVFLFPEKSQLETSDFTFNGQGSISVDHLSSAASQSTTYNSCPKTAEHAGSFSPMPGNSYVISTGECAAGTTQSYDLSANGGLSLEYFQDYNPSPIGLYITSC
ncbi:hypothetical protein KC344_g8559 [Hortaea werneckii]|nr:hypothetical protein KC344_g8559 [Hortaea werneckii]